MRTNLIRVLVLALAVVGLAVVAQPADASCTEQCVRVDDDPFCYRCIDVGFNVGAKCVQRTPCFCYYEECPHAAAAVGGEDALAEPAFLAPEPAEPAACTGDPSPAVTEAAA